MMTCLGDQSLQRSGALASTSFFLQKEFQKNVTGIEQLPIDDISWFSYHMQAMTEELGEVLKADKRWKTHRNSQYNPSEKAQELADVYITVLNMVMFSGCSFEDFMEIVVNKQMENDAKFAEHKLSEVENASNR